MKQVFKNQYVKSYKFSSAKELSKFVDTQDAPKFLSLDESFGDNYYCYIGYHSLTRDKQFVITFSTDEQEDSLNLLFWQRSNLLVLETGKNLYLINSDMSVKTVYDVSTPLVGLYVTRKEHLLILEEAALKLINVEGEILKDELFDLIEDFSIEDDQLSIHTATESKVFELS